MEEEHDNENVAKADEHLEKYGIDIHEASMNYFLLSSFAYIELEIISPEYEQTPQRLIPPALIGVDEYEFVYPIYDSGNYFVAGKGEDWLNGSNCKLFYTIEKMIVLLIDKLESSGIPPEEEVQVNLYGTPEAVRKMFETIINLPHNVVVVNFDPGSWGERFLKILSLLAKVGFGLLPSAPRKPYAKPQSTPSRRKPF